MKALLAIPPLSREGFSCTVTSDGVFWMQGAIQMRTPAEMLGPHLRTVHDAAVADHVRELIVDVTQLSYVNSSSLFLFLDWARWISAEPQANRYVLHFYARPRVNWHQLALPTMQRICSGYVKVSPRG